MSRGSLTLYTASRLRAASQGGFDTVYGVKASGSESGGLDVAGYFPILGQGSPHSIGRALTQYSESRRPALSLEGLDSV